MTARFSVRIVRRLAHIEETGRFDRGRRVAYPPPPALEAVRAFEARHGIALPDDDRWFLTEVGDGGGPSPDGTLVSLEAGERSSGSLAAPFEPARAKDSRPDGMLWVSSCTGLAVTGPERGTLWEYIEFSPYWLPIVGTFYLSLTFHPKVRPRGGTGGFRRSRGVPLLPPVSTSA